MFSRRIAQSFILALVIGLTAMLGVGIWKGTKQQERREESISQTDSAGDAEMRLTDMEYTEMQEGRKLWTLRATEAVYNQKEQKSLLTSVHLTFFFQDGEKAELDSKHGVLYAGTKNIELWDNVHAALPRGYEVSMDHVFYEHQRQVIFSRIPIEISGPEGHFTGNSWEYRIREHTAAFEGGVRATLTSWSPQTQTEQ